MQSGVGIGQEVCCSQQSPTVVIILTEVGGLHDVHRTVVDSTHKSNNAEVFVTWDYTNQAYTNDNWILKC